MLRTLILFSVVSVSAFLLKITANKLTEKPLPEDRYEESEVKTFPRKRRMPASDVSKIEPYPSKEKVAIYRPSVTESERINTDAGIENESSEIHEETERVAETYTEAGHVQGASSVSASSTQTPSGAGHRAPSSAVKSTSSSSPSFITGPIGASYSGMPGKTSVNTSASGGTNNTSSTGVNTSAQSIISCSSNVSGGAYSNPLSVSLKCTSAAEIKYCVSAGACCDPLTGGTVYTSNIIIGRTDGTYCLSFAGTNTSGKTSSVVHNSYVIHADLPHLIAPQNKIYYQTTELPGVTHIASNDFGKLNRGVGVINLKAHNPGPGGLDLSCEDIVTNYVSLGTPSPVVIMNFFDTSGVLVTSQLNVPLLVNHLSYGENYITTYITNNDNSYPMYSCSTSKVILSDFEYFHSHMSHAETGSNSVREFAGGFSPYGFFEDESLLNRTPAGEDSQDLAGQSLESGLFKVLY